MAHFAEIDSNNIVTNIMVVNNSVITIKETGQEVEELGIKFLKSLFGEDKKWVQTSYNANFRNVYAGIGYLYVEDLDIFMPPQPYPSWSMNRQKYEWEPPIPYPNDGKNYIWDESSVSWKEFTPPT